MKADLHSDVKGGRDALLWKLDGLSEYDIRRPLTRTATNVLGLVKHSAAMEILYFGVVFGRPFEQEHGCGHRPVISSPTEPALVFDLSASRRRPHRSVPGGPLDAGPGRRQPRDPPQPVPAARRLPGVADRPGGQSLRIRWVTASLRNATIGVLQQTELDITSLSERTQ